MQLRISANLKINLILGKMFVSKRLLYTIWRDEEDPLKKFLAMETHVFTNIVNANMLSKDQCIEIKKKLRNFNSKLVAKWQDASRNRAVFEKRQNDFLDTEIELLSPTNCEKPGRPTKDFTDSCLKGQVRKVSPLVKENSCEKLMLAASVSLQKAGKRNASQVVSLLQTDVELATKVKKIVDSGENLPVKYSPDEALALYVDGDYTKHSYKLMQAGAKLRNANIYPSYDVLVSAKKKCYPNGMKITDISAEVPLQNLVDHTVQRIIESQSNFFQHVNAECNDNITAIYKWGCDGSSGHSTYRQSYTSIDQNMTDEHLFVVCIVPLQIQKGTEILWKNSRPSSTRFCRPIKLICHKETSDLVSLEIENVKKQILEIIPTNIQNFEIHHQFHMTMIDGKVFSVVAESSNQRCGICQASPKMMNDLDLIKNLPGNVDLYQYGLSTLHAWIRFFECIIHIAYRLPIQRWQVRNSDRDVVNETKSKIQDELRKNMCLLVDIPMAVSGNTNNGNTARRFFQQPKMAAEITGVNESLIERFSVILRTMACGYQINTELFRDYTLKTAQIFVENYPWFYMPSSVHKILIHGADIINSVAIPIGMMSEEALEARNKDLRNFRLHHTRKTSRHNTMQDLAHALLFSSDPLISSLSKSTSSSSKKYILLDKEVRSLLLDLNLQEDMQIDSDSESE